MDYICRSSYRARKETSYCSFVHEPLQKLPQKQKLVFNLRYFDEMKYEDISEITGTSVGALKASYHHAYNKIRTELEEKLRAVGFEYSAEHNKFW